MSDPSHISASDPREEGEPQPFGKGFYADPEAVPEFEPAAREPHPHHTVGVLPAFQSLIVVLIVSLFLMTFTVQPIRIPSASMEPTLLVGDFLLLDRQAVTPNHELLMPPSGVDRGDIVVFHDPIDDPSVHLVKRVIGVPGDRVRMAKDKVYINGQPLAEGYAVYRQSEPDAYRDDFPDLQTMDARVDSGWWIKMRHLVQDGELTVPPGSYFVLGDNRNDSDDSRYWGFVPRKYMVGKPILVYFSWRQPDPFSPSVSSNFTRWDRLFHVVR